MYRFAKISETRRVFFKYCNKAVTRERFTRLETLDKAN